MSERGLVSGVDRTLTPEPLSGTYLSSLETQEQWLETLAEGHTAPGYDADEQVWGHVPQTDASSCWPATEGRC